MATLIETYEYRVANHYACALINGDISGLEDNEMASFDRFTDNLPTGTLAWKDESEGFTQDDVSGLMADCGTLLVHIFE